MSSHSRAVFNEFVSFCADYDRTRRSARGATEDAKDGYYNAKDSVKDSYNDTKRSVRDSYNETNRDLNRNIDEAKDSVKGTYNDAKHSVKDGYRETKESVKDTYNDAKDSVKDSYRDTRDSIKDKYNETNRDLNRSIDQAKQSWHDAMTPHSYVSQIALQCVCKHWHCLCTSCVLLLLHLASCTSYAVAEVAAISSERCRSLCAFQQQAGMSKA